MFLQVAAATPLLGAPVEDPKYKVVTPFKPAAKPGMPGPYPGQVVRVHSEKSLDVATDKVDRAVVKQMLSTGHEGAHRRRQRRGRLAALHLSYGCSRHQSELLRRAADLLRAGNCRRNRGKSGQNRRFSVEYLRL